MLVAMLHAFTAQALDKVFDGQPDTCKALRDVQFDKPTLNKVLNLVFIMSAPMLVSVGLCFSAELTLVI